MTAVNRGVGVYRWEILGVNRGGRSSPVAFPDVQTQPSCVAVGRRRQGDVAGLLHRRLRSSGRVYFP